MAKAHIMQMAPDAIADYVLDSASRHEVIEPGAVKVIRAHSAANQPAIVARYAHLVRDDQSRNLIATASTILALAEGLEVQCGRQRATDFLVGLICDLGPDQLQEWMFNRMGISPDRPDQAFDEIARNFYARGAAGFGNGFVYEAEKSDDRHVFVNITRCVFNDFFKEVGRPDLTRIFCAADNLWSVELDKSSYNASFARPTAMGEGGDRCRFQFTRKDSAL